MLYTQFFGELLHIWRLEDQTRIAPGALQAPLQPYFPEWESNLFVPKWTFREGTYIFQVSLGYLWRRITIPAGQTLDALASIILDAIAFSHDHLYMFSYQNRFGLLERVTHPFLEKEPWTSEVKIGDLPLRVGQTMTYLYDFGDQWEFDVTLERIDPPDASIRKPLIVGSYDEPPEQYPRWDDEEF